MTIKLIIPFKKKVHRMKRLCTMSPQRFMACFGFELKDGKFQQKGIAPNWLTTEKGDTYTIKQPTGLELVYFKGHYFKVSGYWFGYLKFVKVFKI